MAKAKGTGTEHDDAIPAKEWRWGAKGVHTRAGCLTWFNEATGYHHSKQEFDHFRRVGPWAPSTVMVEHEVPEDVWCELHELFGMPPRSRRTREKIEVDVSEAIERLAAHFTGQPLEDCQTCGAIPQHTVADRQGGESLAEVIGELRLALDFYRGGRTFYRCPGCGRLFEYHHEVDNEVWASSDTETLTRVSPASIGEALRKGALVFEWTWDDGWESS